jgi:hypothetical protein
MLCAVRVEMLARRLEAWRFALPRSMDVEAVVTWL